MADQDIIALTADIVSAHVANNRVATNELADLISSIHAALSSLGQPAQPEAAAPEPAVPVRSSIKHDYLVCLEDGKKLKMLKRYLRTNYDMTPDEYRAKWGLPKTYPMVAPAYAETRRGLAQASGLGRKKSQTVSASPAKLSGVAAKAKAAEHLSGDTPKRGRPAKAKNVSPIEAAEVGKAD